MTSCPGFLYLTGRRKTLQAAGGIAGHMKHKKKAQAQKVKPASLVIISQLAAIQEILKNAEREDGST